MPASKNGACILNSVHADLLGGHKLTIPPPASATYAPSPSDSSVCQGPTVTWETFLTIWLI